MKKYELDTSKKIFLGNNQHLYFVYRIKALKDFADVRAGDYGGYVTNPRSQGCPRFQSGEELANSVGKINAC